MNTSCVEVYYPDFRFFDAYREEGNLQDVRNLCRIHWVLLWLTADWPDFLAPGNRGCCSESIASLSFFDFLLQQCYLAAAQFRKGRFRQLPQCVHLVLKGNTLDCPREEPL